jgi:Na+-exporting ATPase
MAFASSTCTKGRCRAIVVATGMSTEIGKIAQSLFEKSGRRARPVRRTNSGETRPHYYVEAAVLTVWDHVGSFIGVTRGTPLQRKLSWLAIWLFLLALLFALIVEAANGFSSENSVVLYAVG